MRYVLLSAALVLSACQNTPVLAPQGANQPLFNPAVNAQSLQSRGVVKSDFSYNSDQTELTVTIEQDNGETTDYQLIRRPVGGSAVTVQTVVKQNGQVTSRHRTTASEAELVIKVAANNGWQNVYRDLKTRYQLAGLS